MYYSHPCSYCNKVFYVFSDDQYQAAQMLYAGIKQHLIDYNEDRKEYEFDDYPETDIDEVYKSMAESNYPPSGGYELE